MSKQFLKYFKRDTLTQLKDLGLLRSKKEFSMGYHLVPALYEQIKLEGFEDEDRKDVIQDTIQVGMVSRSINHKKAIQAELQRREEVKNEKLREEQEAARAKERRHERRKCLKEQKRIQEFNEVLTVQVVPACEQREYTNALQVLDVRDYNPEAPAAIYTFGGFIGELIITLNSLQENLTSKGENVGFELTAESICDMLKELLLEGYPQGICYLKLKKEPLQEDMKENSIDRQAAFVAGRMQEADQIIGYGMKWLNEVAKKVGINEDLVFEVFKALCMIHYHQPKEAVPVPDGDDDQADKIQEQNEEIEKENELYNKLKQYVKLVVPEPAAEGEENPVTEFEEPDYDEADEKCLVRILNYRDAPIESDEPAATLSKNHHESTKSAANTNPAGAADDANSKMDTISETESQKN